MAHEFKQMLAAKGLIRTFALGRIVHPIVIDMFGLAGGYHGFWLDQEHAGVTYQQITTAASAARANGFDSFVRIPPVGYSLVTQCMEAGAGGVMGAQIQSAEQAREFVSWCKYLPRGIRGLNTGGRDADYTHKPLAQFVEDANRDSFVAIQIETLGALEEVEAIAAIEDVDLLFVGPADMSLRLGCVGQFHHDKLWEAIAAVAKASHNHGKHWGTLPPDAEYAQRAVDLDCRMLTMGNELLMAKRGIESLKSTFAARF